MWRAFGIVIFCHLLLSVAAAEPGPAFERVPMKLDREEASQVLVGTFAELVPGVWTENLPDYDDPVRFFYMQGCNPNVDMVVFGNFAINPWTGDLWSWDSCSRLSIPALTDIQNKIKSKFTPWELKYYDELRNLEPRCAWIENN